MFEMYHVTTTFMDIYDNDLLWKKWIN